MFAKDFRRNAWSALSGNWGTMVLITLIVALISGACGGLAFIGIGAIVLLLIEGPLGLGMAIANLRLIRRQGVEISNAFDGFKNFASAFLLYLLNSIFTALWTLLFIIPGIIKAYSYSMGVYILADNPSMDANSARKKSMEIMHGNKWRLFCLDISFIGWYLLCILTLGILTLWVSPYHEAARAEFYQHLVSGNSGGYTNAQDYTQHTDRNNNGGSAFGSGYNAGNSAGSNVDPFTEFGGSTSQDDTLTKDNGSSADDEPPLNADDL